MGTSEFKLSAVERTDREKLNNHRSICIWFTGLPASGKTTIAVKLEEILHKEGIRTFILDGDTVRTGLCKDLGFSPADREENIRRISEAARLFIEAGVVVIASLISPYIKDRQNAKKLFDRGSFIEVFIQASRQTCESRDPKGHYKKARSGEIKEFTGISAPYEEPVNPDLIINTDKETNAEVNALKIFDYLQHNGYLKIKQQNP